MILSFFFSSRRVSLHFLSFSLIFFSSPLILPPLFSFLFSSLSSPPLSSSPSSLISSTLLSSSSLLLPSFLYPLRVLLLPSRSSSPLLLLPPLFLLLLSLSQLVSERCCSLEVDSFDVCLFVCVCPSLLFLLRSKPISSRRQKESEHNNKTSPSLSPPLLLSFLPLNDGGWRRLEASGVFFTRSEGKESDVCLFIFCF